MLCDDPTECDECVTEAASGVVFSRRRLSDLLCQHSHAPHLCTLQGGLPHYFPTICLIFPLFAHVCPHFPTMCPRNFPTLCRTSPQQAAVSHFFSHGAAFSLVLPPFLTFFRILTFSGAGPGPGRQLQVRIFPLLP
jgi:hypothetical protein